MNDEKRLERLKKQFKKKYRRYNSHLDLYDCGISIARTISSTITTYEREMNEMLEEMGKLELKLHGTIPDFLKQRFGVGYMSIKAEVHTDDHTHEVNFDAEKWFDQASDIELRQLKECGFGGDYPADAVARWFEDENLEIHELMVYSRVNNIGYECHVDKTDALAWLKKNRPQV